MVAECDYCGKSVDGLPHKCKYCGLVHCSKHILPESHKCEGLKIHKEKNAERWKETIASVFSSKTPTKEYSSKTYTPQPKYNIPPIRAKGHRDNSNFHKSSKRIPWMKIILVLLIALYVWKAYQTQSLSLGYFGEDSWKKQLSKSDLLASNTAFSLVNSFREENGATPLKIDSNAAKAGISLTKGSVQKNINANVKNELISKYNLSVNAFFFSGDLDEGKGYDINYRVNRWENIARDDILNKSYNSGAVICQNSFCYLIISIKSDKPETYVTSAPGNGKNYALNLNDKFDSFLDKIDEATSINVNLVEQRVHELVNEQRANYGLSPLGWDSKLSDIARAHSEDMAARNYFEHDTPEGLDPTDRGNRAGYSCYKDYGSYYTNGLAENIALTPVGNVIGCGSVYSEEDIAKCTVDGWMTSPGHRQNILTASYGVEGIGVGYSGGDYYITQDFC